MASAMKNWEAQARTNSILAGSLKALEERVDDCAALLDWRNEFEMKVEEMFEHIQTLDTRQQKYQKNMERKEKANAMFSGGIAAVASQGFSTFARSSVTGESTVSAGSGGDADAPDAPPDHTSVLSQPLYIRLFNLMSKATLNNLLYSCFALQTMFCVGFFTSVATNSDESSKALAAAAGVVVLMNVVLGCCAVVKKERQYVNLFLVLQPLLLSFCSTYLQRNYDELTKTVRFCELTGFEGIPDSGCSTREYSAQIRITLAVANIILSVLQAVVMLDMKDKLLTDEIHEKMVNAKFRGVGLSKGSISKSFGQSEVLPALPMPSSGRISKATPMLGAGGGKPTPVMALPGPTQTPGSANI